MMPELKHHGVLGMKWGVRRSQSALDRASGRKAEREVIKDRKNAANSRRLLSDADLVARIGRLEKEKKLRELTKEDLAPGSTAAQKILKAAGTAALTTIGSAGLVYSARALLQGKFDPLEFASALKPKK